jgi:hypothetical protein
MVNLQHLSAIFPQTYTVPRSERIHVRAGDVIGVLYPDNTTTAAGLLTFSDSASASALCCDQAPEDLAVVHRVAVTFADSLEPGASSVNSLDLTRRVTMPFAAILSDGKCAVFFCSIFYN